MSNPHIPQAYNDYIGVESESREYKEFTFNLAGMDIDMQLAEQYCQSNQFDFNTNVIRNLKRYFKVFIPKYTCGFLNSNIDGDFFIGINDYGFAKGIPYQGELPVDYLQSKLVGIIQKFVRINHGIHHSINIEQFVKINFFKIDKPGKPDEPVNKRFTDYLKEKAEYMKRYREYIEKIESWRIRFFFFHQKLVDLVNNYETRIMLIEYIKHHDPTNCVIKLLEGDYQLEYKDHDAILAIKENKSEPYYWVCKWKDEMVDYIRSQRPALIMDFNQNTPMNLITSPNEMIPYWVNSNPDMNLYVCHVQFMTSHIPFVYGRDSNSNSNSYFQYYDLHKKWISCYRTTLPNGDPVCNPFKF